MNKFRRLVSLDSHTLYEVDDARWNALAPFAESVVVEERTDPQAVAAAIGDADCVLTNKTPVTAETIAACPHIKYIGVLATGYNIVDIAAARAAGITVCNVPAYSTASVAQTAITLLLSLIQTPGEYGRKSSAWARCRDFTYRLHEWIELDGKTMGIVGFGNTGRATAAIAAALGMNINVYTSKPQEALPQGYVKVGLDEIFAGSDVVSLHCPLTADNARMVNARTLGLMRPTALLLNTARGGLVDEAALAQALNSGAIAGAGLDVLAKEPPLPDNPLLKARNCLITPHIAWSSKEARKRLFEVTLHNLQAYLAGTSQNIVN